MWIIGKKVNYFIVLLTFIFLINGINAVTQSDCLKYIPSEVTTEDIFYVYSYAGRDCVCKIALGPTFAWDLSESKCLSSTEYCKINGSEFQNIYDPARDKCIATKTSIKPTESARYSPSSYCIKNFGENYFFDEWDQECLSVYIGFCSYFGPYTINLDTLVCDLDSVKVKEYYGDPIPLDDFTIEILKAAGSVLRGKHSGYEIPVDVEEIKSEKSVDQVINNNNLNENPYDALCQNQFGENSYYSSELKDCVNKEGIKTSCNNGIKDDNERGVDCGKSCGNDCICPKGFELNEYGTCNPILVEDVGITRAEIFLSKNSVIMNGNDTVQVSVKLFTQNIEGEEFPYKGSAVLMFSKNIKTEGERIFTSQQGSGFSNLKVYELKGSDDFDVEITLWKVANSPKATLKILSPAPKIKKISVPKGYLWQDSYGKIKVEVEDPDNDINEYFVKVPAGSLRIYEADYENGKAVYVSSDSKFEFGWKAPLLTEKMKLNFLRKILQKAKERGKEFGKNVVNDKLDSLFEKNLAKSVPYFPTREEMGEYYEKAKKGELTQKDVIWYGLTRNKLTKKTTEKFSNYKDFYDDGWNLVGTLKGDVSKQAKEMGEAYESDETFWGEYLTRSVLIGISGFEFYDGLNGLVDEKLKGISGGTVISRMKDFAKNYSIDVAKEGLDWVATNYKAARAKEISVPYVFKITVKDKEGHTDTKGVLVEVSGYETIID